MQCEMQGQTGSVTVKTVPDSGEESTRIVPP